MMQSKSNVHMVVCSFAILILATISMSAVSSSMSKEKILILDKQDNGKEIKVNIGDAIQVNLEAIGGTGYSWYIEKLENEYLELIKKESTSIAKPGLTGGKVKMTWNFRARSKGKTSIELYYYRVWEGKEKAIDSYKISIRII